MPEFFEGTNYGYARRSLPFLDAIARGVRDSEKVRSFLLEGTDHARLYSDAIPLWAEQWAARDQDKPTKGAFWATYCYEPCTTCTCRVADTVSMEIDAIFFLQAPNNRRLAIHVELKRDFEGFSLGQAEAYRPRAACYRDGMRRRRKHVLKHDDYITVLLHGLGTDVPDAKRWFDRVIAHDAARLVVPKYPFS